MKNYLATLTTVLLAGTMFLGFGTAANAQEAPQQAPSDSAAARVSFIHGDLSTQHSDSSEWVAATLNTPVVNGDHISTGKRSRAEIQLDHANVLRMSDESTANVVNLSRTQIQLQVGQGLVNYDVLRNSEANVEIDTPGEEFLDHLRTPAERNPVHGDAGKLPQLSRKNLLGGARADHRIADCSGVASCILNEGGEAVGRNRGR